MPVRGMRAMPYVTYAAIAPGPRCVPSFRMKESDVHAIPLRWCGMNPRMAALAAFIAAALLGACAPLPPRTPPGSKPSTSSLPDTDPVTDPCEDTGSKAARKRCRDLYEQARKGGY